MQKRKCDEASHTARALKQIRRDARYGLWGIEKAIRDLTRLADWLAHALPWEDVPSIPILISPFTPAREVLMEFKSITQHPFAPLLNALAASAILGVFMAPDYPVAAIVMSACAWAWCIHRSLRRRRASQATAHSGNRRDRHRTPSRNRR